MANSIEIPKQHKAAIYDEPGTVSTKVVMVDTPEPGAGQVLIRLTHSGVCHSDFGIMTNGWASLPPPDKGQVGGHEGVGEIVKLGPGLDSTNSVVKVGDRVGIKWLSATCGQCRSCYSGKETTCSKGVVSGFTTPGTFQEYVLGPANYVTPIPDGLSGVQAAPMLCAGVTVYAGMRRSEAIPGDFVVISGAGGGLGHIAVQLGSKGLGYRVIGVDRGSKKDLVLKSGAEFFVDMDQFPTDDGGDAIAKHIQDLTGDIGVQSVIVCPADNRAYASGLKILRPNGVLVCIGIPEGKLEPIASAVPALIIFQQLKIIGSLVGTREDAIKTLDFAARGIIDVHVTVEKLENLTEVFHHMHSGELKGRVVLEF